VPTLRQRREDIPALANYFLREICATLRVPPKALSRPAPVADFGAALARQMPSNFVLLLERVLTGLPGGRGIGLDDVLSHVRLDTGSGVHAAAGTLKQARAQFEREYIASVLEQHKAGSATPLARWGSSGRICIEKMRALRVNRERRDSVKLRSLKRFCLFMSIGALVLGFGARASAQAPDPNQVRVRLGSLWMNPTISLTNIGIDATCFNVPEDEGPVRDFTFTVSPNTDLWLRLGRTWLLGQIREEINWYQKVRRASETRRTPIR